MITICLVRHGETEWNTLGRIQGREDTRLNEKGLKQATECAEILRQYYPEAIFSSPLKRAVKTARIIADELGLPSVKVIDQMTERDFGEISGMTYEERKQFVDRIGGSEYIKGLESFDDLCARAMGELEALAADYEERTIAVVAHGGIINAILWAVSKGEIGTGKTVLQNGSVSIVTRNENGWQAGEINLVTDPGDAQKLKELFS